MYRIAVCDDEMMVNSMVERVIINYQKVCPYRLDVDVFCSGEELCKEMEENRVFFDLIFLDVALVNINGIDVGHMIRDKYKNDITKIVFISGKDDYYRDMIDVRPTAFIHKPLKENEIIEKMLLSIRLSEMQAPMFEYIKERCLYKQDIRTILYFEANSRKSNMVTTEEIVSFYGKLSEVYEKLKKYNFFFCHRSYLVNNTQIKEIRRTEIKMSNGDTIPISRSMQPSVMEFQYKFGKEERNGISII